MTNAKPGGYNYRRSITKAELSHEVIRQELTKIMVGANPSQVSAIARANIALAGGMSAVTELSKIMPTRQ